MSLRVVFMGTAEFAVPVLGALRQANHEILRVYTRPPKPAGRGQKDQISPVHQAALAQGLAVATPASLKTPADQAAFQALGADLAVVVAYGQILPKPILDAPAKGCINVHASLLPRWRGAAPIPRAILAGDRETGVTIIRLDEGIDTGPILLREAVPIEFETNAGDLRNQLSQLGAALALRAIAGIERGEIAPTPQSRDGVTYAAKLGKDEGRLDWNRSAEELELRVRAFAPEPGAWFSKDGERIKVLAARFEDWDGSPKVGKAPGTLVDDRLLVICGRGHLRLLRLQRASRSALPAAEFLRGHPLPSGKRLA